MSLKSVAPLPLQDTFKLDDLHKCKDYTGY